VVVVPISFEFELRHMQEMLAYHSVRFRRLIMNRKLSVWLGYGNVIAFAITLAGFNLGCSDNSSITDAPPTDSIRVRTDFEGSNLASWTISADNRIDVSIRYDTNAEEYRWYSFVVDGGSGKDLVFRITNAGKSNAAPAWAYNRPVVSTDGGEKWSRIVDTSFDGQVYSFDYTPPVNSVWIAYNPVYNFSRWLSLVAELEDHPSVDTLYVLARTREGNPLQLVKITDTSVDDSQKSAIWVVARQHPAEVGGSYMAEGLLRWAIGESAQAQAFRRKSILYMIPFMNPDGVLHGNYRLNEAGLNLNRVWDASDPVLSPTVAAASAAIKKYHDDGGTIRLFADFHSHSTYRKNFFFYVSDALNNDLNSQITGLMHLMNANNDDFTLSESVPGTASNPGIAWAWAYQRLNINSVTFESSYQDISYGSRAGEYMTVERLIALGETFGRSVAEYFYGAN